MLAATCYMVPGKAKSERLCNAFAAGVRACGEQAEVYGKVPDELRPGVAVFYGVRPSHLHLLRQAVREGRDWMYMDNAYFDATRERYFRITRNRLQSVGVGNSDGTRFATLGISIEPWRRRGAHVLVCPQSDEFMRSFCPEGARWTALTVERLARETRRPIRVRPWQANKVEWYKSLPDDLRDCWALVTFSSASAITAMLAGVPAFVTAEDCISRPVANLNLEGIDDPFYSHVRRPWANVVADHQFSLDEIAGGYAWGQLMRRTT